MTVVSMSFAALERALGAYLRIPLEEEGRFRARVKQLQRLGFPSGVNVGRGTRMPYGVEHLMKLSVAFELLDNGHTAKLATDLVERRWDRFRIGISAAERQVESSVYAMIYWNTLSDSSGTEAVVTIEDDGSLANQNWAIRRGVTARTIINLTYLVDRVMHSAEESGRVGTHLIDTEIFGWVREMPTHTHLDDDSWFRLKTWGEDGKPL